MPYERLPQRAEQEFIDELVADWDPSAAVGYGLDTAPGDEAFLPVGRSLADVGETHPHITVMRSNETSGGETTYDFITAEGPGQVRDGELLVTARAEQAQDGYAGDGSQYDPVTAETVVDALIAAVEDVCLHNPTGGDTVFSYLGSQRGADAPDDFDVTPPVMIEQCSVTYGWLRAP